MAASVLNSNFKDFDNVNYDGGKNLERNIGSLETPLTEQTSKGPEDAILLG